MRPNRYQAGMHWDPGTYFNWAHFMALAGAPIVPRGTAGTSSAKWISA
jgi:hypothetical protein